MDCRSRSKTLPWLRMRIQGGCRFTCLAVSLRPLSPSSGSLAGWCREVEKGQGRRQRGEEAHIGSGRVGRCVGKERGWRWHQFSDWSCKQKEIEAYAGNGANQFADGEICELLMPPLIRVPPPASESSSCGLEAGANKPRCKNFHDTVGETSCALHRGTEWGTTGSYQVFKGSVDEGQSPQ